jgi:hypothetical protein
MSSRLSYKKSCKYLVENGWDIACGDLFKHGWAGDGDPPQSAAMPLPGDEAPCAVSFFRTIVGGEEGIDSNEGLQGLTLPRSFICRCEFSEISLANTDFSESFICWNEFNEVDFSDANLQKSDLRASNFQTVNFSRANLEDVDFRLATFDACEFADAKMTGCKILADLKLVLKLTPEQCKQVEWCTEDGEEPPGG